MTVPNTELALEPVHCAYDLGQVSVFTLELIVQCVLRQQINKSLQHFATT